MKLKILMISMLFSNVVSANSSNYIFNIQNKSYVNAIQVVEESNQEEPTNPTINPVCGISNNGIFSSTPTQLCSVGTATAVILNDTLYEWSCQNEQSTIACSATHFDLPVCGTANGVDIDEKPTTNLCEKGTASSIITTNGVHNWTCQSENETTSCSANQIINTAKHTSCKNMLQEYPELLGQDGVYDATVGGLSSKLYCNMTDQGGGWTLILAQFEGDRAGWDEGIQADYDPSLATNKAFTLSSAQIPQHTQISFSHSNYENKRVTNVFNYVYTNDQQIHPAVTITDLISGNNYQIHRNATCFYGGMNPEVSTCTNASVGSQYDEWRNTLTIDQVGGQLFSFAFSYYASTNIEKGYAYKGYKGNVSDSGAWMLYVR